MSLAQLFFKQPNILGDLGAGAIEFDVVVSEGATASATATKNPVEAGADTTDHIRIEPMTFSLSGIVSDTPIQYLAGLQSGSFLTGNKQSQTAWDKLLELQSLRQPFTLTQGLKTYENVIITKLGTTQDASSAMALSFTAEMQEIILVGIEELDSFNFKDPAVEAGMIPNTEAGIKDA